MVRIASWNLENLTTGPDGTPSITDDPTERRHATGSDHRPVLADISL